LLTLAAAAADGYFAIFRYFDMLLFTLHCRATIRLHASRFRHAPVNMLAAAMTLSPPSRTTFEAAPRRAYCRLRDAAPCCAHSASAIRHVYAAMPYRCRLRHAAVIVMPMDYCHCRHYYACRYAESQIRHDVDY